MRLLNVGSGGSKDVPPIYRGWQQDSLDIDAQVNPDIVCDARRLRTLPPSKYDGVYISHCLEHFYAHEVPQVLTGFVHVLKPQGFAHIDVPNINGVFEALVTGKRDIHDTWYQSAGGPISFHDVIYGWSKQVSRGNLYYCHKTGFTETSLAKALRDSGFTHVLTATSVYDLYAFAFKTKPTKTMLRGLELA